MVSPGPRVGGGDRASARRAPGAATARAQREPPQGRGESGPVFRAAQRPHRTGTPERPCPPASSMNTAHPGVSVIIPVFNAERHLASTVASAVRQNPGPLEIIIVDDGSTDGSAAIAA